MVATEPPLLGLIPVPAWFGFLVLFLFAKLSFLLEPNLWLALWPWWWRLLVPPTLRAVVIDLNMLPVLFDLIEPFEVYVVFYFFFYDFACACAL